MVLEYQWVFECCKDFRRQNIGVRLNFPPVIIWCYRLWCYRCRYSQIIFNSKADGFLWNLLIFFRVIVGDSFIITILLFNAVPVNVFPTTTNIVFIERSSQICVALYLPLTTTAHIFQKCLQINVPVLLIVIYPSDNVYLHFSIKTTLPPAKYQMKRSITVKTILEPWRSCDRFFMLWLRFRYRFVLIALITLTNIYLIN